MLVATMTSLHHLQLLALLQTPLTATSGQGISSRTVPPAAEVEAES